MGKSLIIAEKPSVATDIARALGGFKKVDDHYESDQFVLSSAVGHLLELSVPEEYEVSRGKWTFNALPHLPPRFALAPIEKNENRLKALSKLIKRKDVDALINACDAGREGELIFRNIVAHTGAKQPVTRLWLQSMTPAAIRDGFARLRSDPDMQPLADASRCRAEADWLVGINGTRAMTAFNNKSGGFNKTPVGRVQTPTLAVVVEREQRIRDFEVRDYWEVLGTFEAAAGTYNGRWFDERFQRPDGKDGDVDLKPERLWEQAKAEAIRAKCLGKPGVVTEESKPTSQLSPLLFDLTSLQREANGRFGFSAKTTLSLAQALYEKHKALTYPRTDSRHLPEDYPETVRKTLAAFQSGTPYAGLAAKVLNENWVRPGYKRVFNNEKVSDHFAIIPTTELPKNLSEAEQKIYDLVSRRFLAVFFPAAEFQETVRITRVEGEPFKSVGKVLVKNGWLEVYGKEAQADGDTPVLTPVKDGESVATRELEVKQSQTKPPPRYTEATLLSAMEGAGKLVEDDELREAMAEKGLGTPATRAQIIEGLIEDHYLFRNGKELVPTAKAFSLMVLLNGLGVETLTKPELTGEWEHKLKRMERGQLNRDEFMAQIRGLTEEIVTRAKSYDNDTIPGDFGKLTTPCPRCGGELRETYKTFQCQGQGCDWSIYKIILGRQFEPEEVEQLIKEGRIGPLRGFRSKQGRPFDAMMKLGPAPEFRASFDFGEGSDPNGEGSAPPPDFTGQTPIGKCPKCGGNIFDAGMKYVCEHSVGPEKKCAFSASKIILQQSVELPQMQKLLTEGKSDLLKGFVSNRTGRKFEAFLVVKEGKVSFEFAPREAKRKTAKAEKKDAPPPEKVDFTGQTPLGNCPLCQGRVFEGPENYLCENTQRETRPCKFKSGRTVLEQPVERAQMEKLLRDGRTDLLEKFVSRKSGRNFGAYLVLGEKGKVNFEFPER